jgi:hypothetical protein
VAHVRQRLRRAVPGGGRVDEQDCAALAAIAVGDQQRAGAEIHVARQRRDAQEVEALDAVEGEQPRAARGGADDVVIRERRAVVRVAAREHVARETPRVAARRRIRAYARQRRDHVRELRLAQHRGDRACRVRVDRDAPVDLLVLDMLRARGPHALDHEVEAVLLVVADAVVVDGRAQELARAGRERLDHQRLAACGQLDRAAARAVRDAHDNGGVPAVLEVLLDRVGERRRLPEAAEDALEFVEARDPHRAVDRAAQAAADERRHGRRRFRDRLPGAGFFLNLDAGQSFSHG